VGIDQAGSHQRPAEVLDLVDVDDVLDDARNAGGEIGGWPNPDNTIITRQDRGITPHL